jgi:hypothetical protein
MQNTYSLSFECCPEQQKKKAKGSAINQAAMQAVSFLPLGPYV